MRILFARLADAFTIGLFFLGAEAWGLFYWITDRFDTATLHTIIIHLNLPLEAADARYVRSLILILGAGLLATALFALLFLRFGRKNPVPGISLTRLRAFSLTLASLLLFSAAYAWENRYDFGGNLLQDTSYHSYVEDNYHPPETGEIVLPDRKNNLIFLILESVETTMNDERVFRPKLMPRLENFQRNNLSFTGYHMTAGTETSILSFFATILGMPFVYYNF
ncbi:MAG: hypothetical protein LBE84_05650, partial [Planctomycetota bacterium]|nr:hypothetical protein [Planctomycetota bacterium]